MTPRGVAVQGEPVVVLGAHVVIDDLDDGSRSEYELVPSGESNPLAGRLSDASPVGRALWGHRTGDVVDARVPRRVRHLRIVAVDARERPG